MKRYVNFMSNPDERTAIDQFGKGDKCFGIAAVMSTLPGLPMFGHGQIEGFTEKYGMEYYRPRYDETPDHWLVQRHEREIAPLLKRRWIFAESHNFLLYDLFEASGSVDENVFAYSNRNGNERALVVYNNHYGESHGTIHNSAAYADKASSQLRQRRLGDGLGFAGNSGAILAYRDALTGLEYLRRGNELDEHGLTFHLGAYQCHVLMDWHEKWATAENPWDRLCDQLNGRGVPNLEDALVDLELQPVHNALRSLLDHDMVRKLSDLAEHPRTTAGNGTVSVAIDRKQNRKRSELFNVAWTRSEAFVRAAQVAWQSRNGAQRGASTLPGLLGPAFRERLSAAMRIPVVETLSPEPWTAAARRVLPSPSPQMTATAMWAPIIAWCALETLAESLSADEPEKTAIDLFDSLRLRTPLAEAFAGLGFEGEAAWRAAARIKVLLLAESKKAAGSHLPLAAKAASIAGSEKSTLPKPVKAEDAAPATVGQQESAVAKPKPVSSETSATTVTTATAPIVGGLPRELWSDPDVRWLTGAHEAGEDTYLVLEPFEELTWWLQLPTLLRIAGNAAPRKAEVKQVSATVQASIAVVEEAGYRLQSMLGEDKPKSPKHSDETAAGKSQRAAAQPILAVDTKKPEKKPV
jgi:hypothetical protein